MTSTYARVMTGGTVRGPAVDRRWVYLLVATLLSAMAAMSLKETVELLAEPAGVAAVIAIAAGFLVRRSMALTPWGFVCVSLAAYTAGGLLPSVGITFQIAQFLAIIGALTVAMLQLRVELTSGEYSRRAPRARGGALLVATTAAMTVIVLGFSEVPLVQLVQGSWDVRPEAAVRESDYRPAVRVGSVGHPALVEGSGLAASRVNPGLMWAHNDSGHAPHIYCMAFNGDPCGVWSVTGAESRDWEDMAIGPGPAAGRSYLYVGDIGDNVAALRTVTIYRVPEPKVDAGSRDSTVDTPIPTTAADSIDLRYPDGPHDAEVLIVHPHTGDVYIITKELVSGVYRAVAPLDTTGTTTLELVGRFSIFATLADRTGGTISPDGLRVALATYGGGFELLLRTPPGGAPAPFDSIWNQTPSRISVPNPGQLEAITYTADGRSVLLMPEGARSSIFRAELQRSRGGS